ncbi:MAG: DNA polymerase III subunit gamma/tau C-terminal domain-containing protein, partial [Gammaproteobacteria bacterium]
LPLSPDARNGFEMILLRMLAFRPASAGDSMGTSVGAGHVVQAQAQTAAATNKIAEPAARSPVQEAVAIPPAQEPVPATTSQSAIGRTTTAQTSVAGNGGVSEWREIVNALGLGGLVKQLAVNCTIKRRDGNNVILQIASGHSNLINPKAKQRLQQALGEYFDIEAKLDIEVVSKTQAESPAQTVQRETVQRQEQAVQSINEDSFAQSLKENFNAEVIPGSVKPVT